MQLLFTLWENMLPAAVGLLHQPVCLRLSLPASERFCFPLFCLSLAMWFPPAERGSSSLLASRIFHLSSFLPLSPQPGVGNKKFFFVRWTIQEEKYQTRCQSGKRGMCSWWEKVKLLVLPETWQVMKEQKPWRKKKSLKRKVYFVIVRTKWMQTNDLKSDCCAKRVNMSVLNSKIVLLGDEISSAVQRSCFQMRLSTSYILYVVRSRTWSSIC